MSWLPFRRSVNTAVAPAGTTAPVLQMAFADGDDDDDLQNESLLSGSPLGRNTAKASAPGAPVHVRYEERAVKVVHLNRDTSAGPTAHTFLETSPSSSHAKLSHHAPTAGVTAQGSMSLLGLQQQQVIDNYNALPKWTDVLTGTHATGSFEVPESLQDLVMGIKLTSSSMVLAYDPVATQRVLPYLGAISNEATQRGLTVKPGHLLVTTEVLKKLRLAADGRQNVSTKSNSPALTDEIAHFREWVETAKEVGATDIHMNLLDGGRGEVMLRVDGEQEHLPQSRLGLSSRDVLRVMRAVYETLADRHSNSSGSFSETAPLACMVDSKLGIANLRLRFATMKGVFGPKCVMRLLPTEIDAQAMAFEDMGFAPSHMVLLETAQRMSQGLGLQCGITGSGKTTAAKTFMETHPLNGRSAMYQLADPIEYLLRGVHQIPIQRDLVDVDTSAQKGPYTVAIEAALRMDPDLVDVGEIRDRFSARAALTIAKSGHMSLGTLHVGRIEGIANRLCDEAIGLSRNEITGTDMLALLTYQALVPKLCPHCCLDHGSIQSQYRQLESTAQDSQSRTTFAKESAFLVRLLLTLSNRFDVDLHRLRFRNNEGCAHCRGRGTKGLTMVAEMMIPDRDWLDLTQEGQDRAAWHQYRQNHSDLMNAGMRMAFDSPNMDGKTVQEHALYKAIAGADGHGMIDPRRVDAFGPLERYLFVN